MPNPTNKGTNSSGNQYTAYDNGAYRYTNSNEEGKIQSRYYNDGREHGFYRKNNPGGYSFHENPQGERTYKPSGGSKKWSSRSESKDSIECDQNHRKVNKSAENCI